MLPIPILKILFRSLVWDIPAKEPVLFVTFDDGPIPGVTSYVLDALKKYNAKVTFFCIGENVEKHPDVYRRIISDGHAIGNHTYNHLNGWKTKTVEYIKNIEKCESSLNFKPQTSNLQPLFRPPYGKITPSQISNLKSQYSLIMWNVLSNDWKQNLSGEDCFERIKTKAQPGSIIVFHDSLKAEARMKPALEKTLQYFSEKGYRFESLS